jgi:hypothetical protein
LQVILIRQLAIALYVEVLKLSIPLFQTIDSMITLSQVHFHVCAGFFKWHWKYDADASASGKSGHSHHDDSKDGAAKNALVDLFANQLTQGDCSCTVSTIPVGKCPIRFSVCFMFNDTGCVDRHAPSFNAWAHNTVTNKEGSVRRYADPKQAGTDALTALFVGSPGDKAVCFPPEYDVVDSDLSNALHDLNVPSL